MTIKQNEIADKVRAFAFPVLISVLAYFLIRVLDSVRDISIEQQKTNAVLYEIKTQQEVMKWRLDDLSTDSMRMQTDIEAIKKNTNENSIKY